MTPLSAILIYIFFGTTIGALGPIFLKKSSKDLKFHISFIKNKYFLLGGLMYVLGTISFIYALKFVELSVLYPTVGIVYIWTSLFSIKMLGEKMSRKKWLGIFFILVGVAFIGLGNK